MYMYMYMYIYMYMYMQLHVATQIHKPANYVQCTCLYYLTDTICFNLSTQSQYIFIHHAILEDIVYGDSTVLLKNYFQKYLKLQASHCALIKGEYEKIGTVRPPAQASSGPNIIKIRAEG